MKKFRNSINGKHVDAADGSTLDIINPATGIEYGALNPIGEEPYAGGAMLVSLGAKYADEYANAADEDAQTDAYYNMVDIVDLINLSRSMYTYFGTSF